MVDSLTLTTIQAEQLAYYRTAIVPSQIIDGKLVQAITRDCYKQVLPSEKRGYWIEPYEGWDGAAYTGYIIREEQVVNGVTSQRATNVGPEDWRSHDWLIVQDPK